MQRKAAEQQQADGGEEYRRYQAGNAAAEQHQDHSCEQSASEQSLLGAGKVRSRETRQRSADLQPAPGPRRWWQVWPFWKAPNAILELHLDRLGDVDFKTVRDRVIKLTKVAMADDDPEDRKEVLANLRRAEDLKDLAEELGLPDRMGFFD